jgi:hypothetical protein
MPPYPVGLEETVVGQSLFCLVCDVEGGCVVSRSVCNRILAFSAVVALLIVLNYTLFVYPPGNLLQGVLEVVGKTALLWPVIALVLGVLAEALIVLTGRVIRRVE